MHILPLKNNSLITSNQSYFMSVYCKYEQKYLNRFNSFFNNEKLSSTYKPVFLKSLLDISDYDDEFAEGKLIGNLWIEKDDERLRINLNFIAIRYIKYYWEFLFKFKLKQSHSPLDANINTILRKVNKEPKTPSLELLASEGFIELRKEVINRSIKPEVLVHLDPIGDLYKRHERSDSITVDMSLIDFLKTHKGILLAALNFMITRYLEKINFVPRIAEKVAGSIPRTHLNNKEKTILLELHDDSCFYCQAKSQRGYHMDHVIPFNYLYQTEIFNIVPSCNTCNSSKNDRLPTLEVLERVIERNKKLILRRDYTDEWYRKLYDTCITSYHGNRPFFNPLYNVDRFGEAFT